MKNIKLLNTLLNDEKLNNKDLYSSGPYWNYKNSKTTYEIKKRGILEMPRNSREIMIIKKSKEIDNVAKHMENTTIIKNIYIKNKLVNFITKK